jgi:hypothetical protein
MLINQLTPHLPKDNEEVTAHVKRLQAMLDVATVVDPVLNRDDEACGHDHNNRRVHTGIWQAISLHRRNAAEGETGMTEICAISSMSVMNRSSVKKGTMTTMVPITTNLTDSVLLRDGIMQEELRHSPKT